MQTPAVILPPTWLVDSGEGGGREGEAEAIGYNNLNLVIYLLPTEMLNEVETECCQNSAGDYNIFHSLHWRTHI